MNDAAQLRIAELRQLHPEIVEYRDQLLLNAFCIDTVHGSAYAWAYLIRCGLPYEHVQAILRTATDSWDFAIKDLVLTADSAMTSAGLQHHLPIASGDAVRSFQLASRAPGDLY